MKNIIHNYEASGQLHNYGTETESFVAFPGKLQKLAPKQISGRGSMKNIDVDGTEDMVCNVRSIEDRQKPPSKIPAQYINVETTENGMKVLSVGSRRLRESK